MVFEKAPSSQQVRALIFDSRIKFWGIDQMIVHHFDTYTLSKVHAYFEWLQEQKNSAKEILRNETGRSRLPKTPKHRNRLLKEAEAFEECRKKLVQSIQLTKNYFANEGQVLLNKTVRNATTPKNSKHPLARNIKFEPVSCDVMNNLKTPTRPVDRPKQQNITNQQTPYKTQANKPSAVESLRNNTPMRTPANKLTSKIVLTPKAAHCQPTVKRSEMIREIETRANAVIKNKEELMKEKAERARRDREERAMRVKMNNKRKEEEALERLRIIKKREQKLEALRQQQLAPQRAISKSPCRTRGYNNRTQKPLTRALSTQDISTSKNAIKNDVAQNKQIQGKRNREDSIKQFTNEKNKRQKLDRMKSSTGSNVSLRITRSSALRKNSSSTSCASQALAERSTAKNIRDTEKKSSSKSCQVGENSGTSENEKAALESGIKKTHLISEKKEIPFSPKVEEAFEVENSESLNFEKSKSTDSISVEVVAAKKPSFDIVEASKENWDEQQKQNQLRQNAMEVETVVADTYANKNQTSDLSMDISNNETSCNDDGNNYNVDDLSSNDETDDEDHPRKPIPLWAQGERLSQSVRQQVLNPPVDIDNYFGPVRTPKLDKIFSSKLNRYTKRTSSAQWSSPLSNPKIGTSKFFELQNVRRGDVP